jgi:predicted alpha/beta-hydrolase family hydrolase
MSSYQEFFDSVADAVPVRGFLHSPSGSPEAGLVLTHGAGANCASPLLVSVAEALCAAGWIVLRCDLPFRQSRPHGSPPRGSAERDQQGLRAAVASLRKQTSARMYLGGHSYGGRQASMLAAGDPGLVEGLLLLSYPLHPPQRPSELRTAHFPRLQTPALFVYGVRDGFGSMEEMTAALKLIPARTELLAIDGAGHELMTKRNQNELPRMIAEAFREFTLQLGNC